MQPTVRLNPQPQYEVIPSNVVKKDGIINLNCNWNQQPNPMTITLNFIKQVISMQMVIKPKGNMPGMPMQGMHPGMHPGMQQFMQPGMQPNMMPGMQPGMQQNMMPGMQPGMYPGMQSGMNPQFGNPQFGSNPGMSQFGNNQQFVQPNLMPNMASNQPMNLNKQHLANKVFDECMQLINGYQ